MSRRVTAEQMEVLVEATPTANSANNWLLAKQNSGDSGNSQILSGMYHSFVGGRVRKTTSEDKMRLNVEVIVARYLHNSALLQLTTSLTDAEALKSFITLEVVNPDNWYNSVDTVPVAVDEVLVRLNGDTVRIDVKYTEVQTGVKNTTAALNFSTTLGGG